MAQARIALGYAPDSEVHRRQQLRLTLCADQAMKTAMNASMKIKSAAMRGRTMGM